MKTRIAVTWPKLTADQTAKMFGISPKRQREIQQIVDAARQRVETKHRRESAKLKKAEAA